MDGPSHLGILCCAERVSVSQTDPESGKSLPFMMLVSTPGGDYQGMRSPPPQKK